MKFYRLEVRNGNDIEWYHFGLNEEKNAEQIRKEVIETLEDGQVFLNLYEISESEHFEGLIKQQFFGG